MAKYSFRLHWGPYFSTDLQLFCRCSAAKSCLTPCEPMNCSSSGFPILHYLLEFAQTHVHWVSDDSLLGGILVKNVPLGQVEWIQWPRSQKPFDLAKHSYPPHMFRFSHLNKGDNNCSLLFSHQVMFDSSWPHGLQYARHPCPPPPPRVSPSSCPLHQWYHPAISSSVVLFSFCLQSF